MNVEANSAYQEWRQYYALPIMAGLGYATMGIHVYAIGVYIGPVSKAFGWSRTLTTVGLSLAMIIQAIFAIPGGMLVDRIGSRLLAIVGMLMAAAAFALLGTATGDAKNWYLLWALMGLAVIVAPASVWTSAIAARFKASRGLAFSVALSGSSIATALFPYLGAKLIAAYGWRTAFAAEAGLWIAVAFPLVFMFFRDEPDPRKSRQAQDLHGPSVVNGITFLDGLRSTIYVRILLAGFLFTFTTLPITVHFVPMLASNGFSTTEAAGIASLIGVSSFIGRMATGVLLDSFRASIISACVFLLPAAACILLLATGYSLIGAIAATVLIGLTVGAEITVQAYLAGRYFGRKAFGALLGGILTANMIGAATGPVGGAWIFDRFGNYTLGLWLVSGLTLVSSLAMASLPRPPID